ncbi:MAG: hypothetical protein AABW83_04235 [Nanoarchaeota archaeon]
MKLSSLNDLDNLSTDYYDDVRRFCIEDLSGIFYRCLEHEKPRDKLDWLIAEKYIDRKAPVYDFTKKFLVLSVFEELRKIDANGNFINIVQGLSINSDYSNVSSEKLENILGFLDNFLTKDIFKSIIKNLSLDERRAYQKKFLGRDVWDKSYQPFRRMIEDLTYLEIHGYNFYEVLFK